MKARSLGIKAVGFDFGGTIIPIVKKDIELIVSETLEREMGFNKASKITKCFREFEKSYWNDSTDRPSENLARDMLEDAAKAVGAYLPLETSDRIISIISSRLVAEIEPCHSAAAVMVQLASHGMSIGLLSNWLYPTRVLQDWIGAHGLNTYFDCVLGSAELGVRKPNPKAFQLLASCFRLPAYSIAYVGDNFKEDICGAVEAGCGSVIWVDRTGQGHCVPNVSTVRSLAEIPPLLL